MKKALIFGISGQDGYYLSLLLLQQGYAVYGTSRDADGRALEHLRSHAQLRHVQLFSVSTHDFYSVFRVINDVRPDEVYNLSGQSSVGLSFQQPLETHHSIVSATTNILEVARLTMQPMRMYFAGSSETFGDTSASGATEATPLQPKSPYGVAKAAAYWQVKSYRESYGLFAATGILFNHESRMRPPRFVTRKIIDGVRRIAAGDSRKLELGDLSIARDWGHAPDYVDAMWRIVQQDTADDFVVATGRHHTLQNFVELAFSKVGLDWHDWVVSDTSLRRPNEIQLSCGRPDKAGRVLGWHAKRQLPELIDVLMADSAED